MDDSTKTGGTVVQLYTSDSAVRTSPRQLQGTLLTFVDKQFFAGAGRYKMEVPAGTRFVVVEVRAGWKRWQDQKVAEFVTEIRGHYPQRYELGHTDESNWPRGPGGKSADVWQDSREVLLMNETDYSGFTFCTATGGGRAAVDALRRSMQNANLLRPGQMPIIELQWLPMHTDYGTKSKPDLRIVGWLRQEAPAIAPPDDPAS
jgi:hypothetical protein